MTNLQIDLLNMFYETKNTCEHYQTVWSPDVVFTASYNAFIDKLPLIQQNRDAQLTPTKWATLDKEQKKKNAEGKTLFAIKRIQSFANATNNNELFSSVNFNPSALKRARDSNLIGICNIILSKAIAYEKELTTYGITAEVIGDLKATIAAFSDSLTIPGAAKSGTKTATENLALLFKETESILTKRLDLDIEVYKTSNPDFFSQYKTARMVISKSGRSIMLKAHAEDATSGAPLKNATFTFTPQTDATVKIVKKSAIKGNLRLGNIAEGIYNVTVEKTGYTTQQLTVTVVKGENCNMVVRLNKIL
jgi:hypothetical protein